MFYNLLCFLNVFHLERIKTNDKFHGKNLSFVDSGFEKTCDELVIGKDFHQFACDYCSKVLPTKSVLKLHTAHAHQDQIMPQKEKAEAKNQEGTSSNSLQVRFPSFFQAKICNFIYFLARCHLAVQAEL